LIIGKQIANTYSAGVRTHTHAHTRARAVIYTCYLHHTRQSDPVLPNTLSTLQTSTQSLTFQLYQA